MVHLRFYVRSPFIQNLLTNILPTCIIVVQNILLVWMPSEAPDFLGNASGIALNLVFLLPTMYPAVCAPSGGFGYNDLGVFLILISLLGSIVKLPWSGIGFWMVPLDDERYEDGNVDPAVDPGWGMLDQYNLDYDLPITFIWGLQVETPPSPARLPLSPHLGPSRRRRST